MVTYDVEHPLANQILAYEELKEKLEREHFGKWAVIHGSEFVGAYESFSAAKAVATEKGLEVLDCYIRQVGVEAPIILSHGG